MPSEAKDFSECPECKQKLFSRLWIHAFASFQQAQMNGQSPDLLGMLMPSPGLLKIEVCLGCALLRPCLELTAEELELMVKHVEAQKEQAGLSASIARVLGTAGKGTEQ